MAETTFRSYKKSEMVYTDYKWTAKADHDNPEIIGFPDNLLLNRTEGYEMLHFINSIAKLGGWGKDTLLALQRLERIIREKVPANIHSRAKIVEWIAETYKEGV